MTDIYELWDHKCPELEALHKEGKVRFQGWACWCSPMERHYQILDDDGEWIDIYNCPFCKTSMTGWNPLPTQQILKNSTVMIFLDIECPSCDSFYASNFKYCPWCGVKNDRHRIN